MCEKDEEGYGVLWLVRKISFVVSVRQHATTRLPLKNFHEIWYLRILRKSVENIEILLKSEENNGYFM